MVRSAYSIVSCETTPTSARSFGPALRISMPAIRTLPDVGAASPEITFSSVVLPAPFAPMTATKDPCSTTRSTWSSAS